MRKTRTAGVCAGATLGILVLGTVYLGAQESGASATEKKYEKGMAPVVSDMNGAAGRKTLSFDYKEALGDQDKRSADELVRDAANAYRNGMYPKAIDLYLAAIKKLEELQPQSNVVAPKIQSCRLAVSKCYFYWAEKLYFEALDSADLRQYDEAIQKCEMAASIWPASKKKMEETVEMFKKMKNSASYVENTKEEILIPELKERIYSTEVLLRQGDAFYADGQWANARSKYEEVLEIDPYNVTAIDSIRKANRKLINAGKRRRNVAKQQYNAEAIWTPVIPLIPREGVSSGDSIQNTSETKNPIVKDQRSKTINEKLDNIIIPSLEFEQELVSEVLKQLQNRSQELTNGNGVNIVYLSGDIQRPAAQTSNQNSEGGEGGEGGGNAASSSAESGASEEKMINLLTENVPLRNAIQTICNTADLKYKIEDYAVVVAPKSVPLDEMETQIFPIEKTTYDDMGGGDLKAYFSDKLQIKFDGNAGIKYISGRLVVTNTPENIQRIRNHIEAISVEDPQILIEAKFMEIAMNDMEELGFHYLISRQPSNLKYYNQDNMTGKITYVNNTFSEPFPSETVNFYYPVNATSNGYPTYYDTWKNNGTQPKDFWPANTSTMYYMKSPIQNGGSQLSFGQNTYGLTRTVNDISSRTALDGLFSAQYTDYSSGFSVSGAVTALDQADSSDVLFCPRLTTTNNYEATITMGTKKYFPTDWEEAEVGTIASGGRDVPMFTASVPELEETELGVKFSIKPQVEDNGRTITLPINPTVKEHVGWVDYSYPVTVSVAENQSVSYTNIIRMPIFEDREVNTTISCDDGETIILGSVVHDTTNALDDQYPLLGSIPLIGRLFQSKAKVSEKKNLLIFMTCRQITPDGSPLREREMRGLPPFRQ